MGGTVKSEDGGLLKFAGHFLADEESVLFSVDVLVEIFGELVIPVDLEAELIEHIEARMGVARKEIAVGAGGFAKDDPLQLQVAEAGDEFDVFEQVWEDVGDERVGIGGCGVECLNEGAAADRASVGLEKFAEIIVGADDDGAVFYGAALAADGDLSLGFGLTGIARWVVVEALVEASGGGEEALALLRQGLDFSIDTRGGAIDVHGHDGVDDGLVARVVDFEHDIRAERLDGIEEDGAGVNAEVAGAGVEDDEVLLQIHGATCEDA